MTILLRFFISSRLAAVLARATPGIVLACGALLGAGCSRGSAEAAAEEPPGGAITLWTDSTELFMEHPALIVGSADKFAVHLTDLTDFAPLRSGRITLRFQPRGGGAPVVVVQEAPRSPGIYGPSPEFPAPGVYDLTLLIDSPQARDSVTVPGLHVYATVEDVPREAPGGDAGIPFLKEQQWKTPGFATAFADSGVIAAAFEAPGTIEPAAGRYAEISAPTGGLVDVAGIATSPAPGQRVARGQVLAYLTPALGEGGSAPYSEARARLREAEDEYARAKRLVEAEAAPARRLHEAEIRLQAAGEALAGMAGGGLASDGRLPVRSPIAGVVARRSIMPGSHVSAGTPLFTIIDPSVVWLAVNVPARQAPLVSRARNASFQVEGGEQRYLVRRLVSVGSIIDPGSRTLPLIYEVSNGGGAVKVGAIARVQVASGERMRGVVIPASAVLDEDGRAIAYVQVEGETFEKRIVQLGGQEGDRVLILSGIRSGERVVIRAAYQVRLASLSTAVPAHGHEH